MSKEQRYPDEMVIVEWRTMLDTFKDITKGNPPLKDVIEPLTALQEKAQNSVILTGRQREGVYERCQNYLNGTYGKNLSHVA